MLLFMGMARSTPSAATARTQAATRYHPIWVPRGFASVTDRRSIAGTAVTTIVAVVYPAADAVDCMQLFSRIVIGVFATPARTSALQIVNDAMHAVSATPRPQPVLSPTYTFVKARRNPSTVPIPTARHVNCVDSPRKARSRHSASSIAPTSSGGMARGRSCSASREVLGGFWKRGIQAGARYRDARGAWGPADYATQGLGARRGPLPSRTLARLSRGARPFFLLPAGRGFVQSGSGRGTKHARHGLAGKPGESSTDAR